MIQRFQKFLEFNQFSRNLKMNLTKQKEASREKPERGKEKKLVGAPAKYLDGVNLSPLNKERD